MDPLLSGTWSSSRTSTSILGLLSLAGYGGGGGGRTDGAPSSKRLRRDWLSDPRGRTPVRQRTSDAPFLHISRSLRTFATRAALSRSTGKSLTLSSSDEEPGGGSIECHLRSVLESPKTTSGNRSGLIAKSEPLSSTRPTYARSRLGRPLCFVAVTRSASGKISWSVGCGCSRTNGCWRLGERRTSNVVTLKRRIDIELV